MEFKPQPVDDPPVVSNSTGEEVSTQVGYKRPPTKTQFKRGHSGNPKGRRKSSKNTGALLTKVLREKISVSIDGKVKRMSKAEALVMLKMNGAIKGDAKAIDGMLSIAEKAGRIAPLPKDGAPRPGFLVVPGPARDRAEWERDCGAAARGERPRTKITRPMTVQAGDELVAAGKLGEAFDCFRRNLSNCKHWAAEDTGDADVQKDLEIAVQRITIISYHSLLAREFTRALEAADLAISELPQLLWFCVLRALALMFLGRVDEARALFHKYQGQKVHFERSWDDIVLRFFDAVREHDLRHPLISEIETQFAAGG